MAITLDAVTLQPIKAAPTTPVVAPAVVAADPARGQARESKNDRGGKDSSLSSFRAVLNAVASGAVTANFVQADAANTAPQARPERVPKSTPAELNGSESSVMLEAAYARREQGASAARVYLAATSRYAQAFFADTRTYARPGESLEMTV